VAAEYIGGRKLESHTLLTGIDQVGVRRHDRDGRDVTRLDGITEDDPHASSVLAAGEPF
jgi:hypothetical protein